LFYSDCSNVTNRCLSLIKERYFGSFFRERFNLKALQTLMLVFILVGCSDYSSEFTKIGEITRIEEGIIYIDDSPIKIKDTSDFEMGQRVKVTLIDKTGEDDWDPNDFKVKEIDIIK